MLPDDKKNEIINVEASSPESPGNNQADSANASTNNDTNNTEPPEQASAPFSVVASTPQYKKVMIIGIVLAAFGLLYYIFFGRPLTKEEMKERKDSEIASQKEQLLKTSTPVTKPVESTVSITPQKLPEPPPLTEPTPPEPPPPPIPLAPSTPIFNQPTTGGVVSTITKSNAVDLDKQKKIEAKRKAGMIVVGGSGSGAASDSTKKDGEDGGKDSAQHKKKPTDSFLGFGNGSLDSDSIVKTSAEQVKATRIGNTDNLIAQGKIINAVLETAINTDLPGMLRATITRDVYAESGKSILIPKGSRVVGSYDSEVKDGQTRVSIAWDRLIRPDGIDIAISSPGTDQLGRSGVAGHLDSKFWTKLGSALLVSYIIPVLANKLANVNGNTQTSTTTTTGSSGTTSTTQSTFAAQQAQEASKQFTDVGKQIVQSTFSTKPTITVTQGTAINIFVKKDLSFPSAYSISNMQVIK